MANGNLLAILSRGVFLAYSLIKRCSPLGPSSIMDLTSFFHPPSLVRINLAQLMSHFAPPNGCTSHRVNWRLKRLSALPLSVPGQCRQMGLNSLRGSGEIDVLEVKNKQREWNHVFMAANRCTARDENGKHQTRNKSIVKSILSGNVNTARFLQHFDLLGLSIPSDSGRSNKQKRI